jgi:hypothetical protein
LKNHWNTNAQEGSMHWYMLVTGAPEVPADLTLEEIGALPRPMDLFRALYAELLGIRLTTWTETGCEIEPRELQVVHGFFGNAACGLRVTEQLSLATSMLPLRAHIETYGLPGMQIIWLHDWEKYGQGGHCRFKHGELRAAFATPELQAHFARIWHRIFGNEPQFRLAETNTEAVTDA